MRRAMGQTTGASISRSCGARMDNMSTLLNVVDADDKENPDLFYE
jgi:hypothetical protein